MKYLSRLCLLALVGLMPLAQLGAQQKGIGSWQPVKDDIGFFSPAAEEQANQKVAALKKTFNKDLFIEAMKAPPHPKDLDIKDKKAVNAFFDHFAEKRFANLHESGVYVMIVDNPHILRVVIGNNTQVEGYFTLANRNTLTEKMLEKLKAGDKDGALLFAADYVTDTIKANHPVANRKSAVAPANAAPVEQGRSTSFNWSPIIMIVLVVAGVWILFAIVRALFSSGGGGGVGAPGMGYGGGGGGGGGFFSSLLGGMFGAAAGMWMYNSFFGGHSSSAFGAGPSDAGGGASTPDSGPADTSGSAGGGDYGNDDAAGGGDWGGGDAGGGDVGGGDWGGGGGDWGGGGGDFGGGGGDW